MAQYNWGKLNLTEETLQQLRTSTMRLNALNAKGCKFSAWDGWKAPTRVVEKPLAKSIAKSRRKAQAEQLGMDWIRNHAMIESRVPLGRWAKGKVWSNVAGTYV